jgi:hypothetical protein
MKRGARILINCGEGKLFLKIFLLLDLVDGLHLDELHLHERNLLLFHLSDGHLYGIVQLLIVPWRQARLAVLWPAHRRRMPKRRAPLWKGLGLISRVKEVPGQLAQN